MKRTIDEQGGHSNRRKEEVNPLTFLPPVIPEDIKTMIQQWLDIDAALDLDIRDLEPFFNVPRPLLPEDFHDSWFRSYMDQGKYTQGELNGLFVYLAEYNKPKTFQHMLNLSGANSSGHVFRIDDNNEVVHSVSYQGSAEVINFLLAESRVEPSENNNVIIRCGFYYDYVEVIKMLFVDSRVDLRDSQTIRWASRFCTEVTDLLKKWRRYNNIILRPHP